LSGHIVFFKRRCRVWVYYLELPHRSYTAAAAMFIMPVTVTARTELTKNVAKGPLFSTDIFLTLFHTLHP